MELSALRVIDIFGRLYLPFDLREKLNWKHNDVIELYTKGNEITLRLSKEKLSPYSCYQNKDVKDCGDCGFCENGVVKGDRSFGLDHMAGLRMP